MGSGLPRIARKSFPDEKSCCQLSGLPVRRAVAEVSERLGVSSHSLHKWVKAVQPEQYERRVVDLGEAKSEILKLRAQPRTEEERDILKKTAPIHQPRVLTKCQ